MYRINTGPFLSLYPRTEPYFTEVKHELNPVAIVVSEKLTDSHLLVKIFSQADSKKLSDEK